MKKTAQICLGLVSVVGSFLVMSLSMTAAAESAQLKIAGDLMIHPDQVANFFQAAADRIHNSSGWDWPALSFTKPYKTSWTQVQARGPFDMTFTTDNLKDQEVGFELNWNDPTISVGQFQIDDTITRQVGGATIILHLVGQCTGMMLTIPSGQWKVKGHLGWTWDGAKINVKWIDFSLAMNGAAVPQTQLGHCEGPTGLPAALQQALDAISRDQSWLQDVLHDGVMNWVEGSLAGLQSELLKSRSVTLQPGLDATWTPDALSGVAGGLVRVAGHLQLAKDSATKSESVLERSYADSSLPLVKESGFVLPKSTVQALTTFAYSQGELQYRTTSDKVDSFQSLMQSRFLQFFVWPDLMQFAKDTVFYFDVTTGGAPKLTNGVARDGGGVSYDLQAPLLVHQLAPANNQYLPYVDFGSAMSGRIDAFVQDQSLVLQLAPNDMTVTSAFRDEYSGFRQVNAWLATSLLGSRVKNYLMGRSISTPIPDWQLGDNMALSIRDVQMWKYSFRVPLQFKNSK